MKKFTGLLKHGKRSPVNESATYQNGADTPEEIAARSVRLFCESAGPSNNVSLQSRAFTHQEDIDKP